MQTEATQQPVYPPLQVAETIPKEQSGLRIIHKKDETNSLDAQPGSGAFQCESEEDPSWFANYE